MKKTRRAEKKKKKPCQKEENCGEKDELNGRSHRSRRYDLTILADLCMESTEQTAAEETKGSRRRKRDEEKKKERKVGDEVEG